jgi:hypothetical protein
MNGRTTVQVINKCAASYEAFVSGMFEKTEENIKSKVKKVFHLSMIVLI